MGLEEDLKKLTLQTEKLFDEHDGLRFEHFVTVWKDMHFGLVRNRMLFFIQDM